MSTRRRRPLPLRQAQGERSGESARAERAGPARAEPVEARPGTVTVRDARAEDVPTMAGMGARLAREHHGMDPARFFLPEEPIEDGYAWWLGKELVNPRAVLLVAVRRGRTVGYAYGRIEKRDWNTLRERCAVGVDLWVEPRARRAGAGRQLVEALSDRFAARGEARLVLQVAAENEGALEVFAGMGFRRTVVELARELAPPVEPRAGRSRPLAPSPSKGARRARKARR